MKEIKQELTEEMSKILNYLVTERDKYKRKQSIINYKQIQFLLNSNYGK